MVVARFVCVLPLVFGSTLLENRLGESSHDHSIRAAQTLGNRQQERVEEQRAKEALLQQEEKTNLMEQRVEFLKSELQHTMEERAHEAESHRSSVEQMAKALDDDDRQKPKMPPITCQYVIGPKIYNLDEFEFKTRIENGLKDKTQKKFTHWGLANLSDFCDRALCAEDAHRHSQVHFAQKRRSQDGRVMGDSRSLCIAYVLEMRCREQSKMQDDAGKSLTMQCFLSQAHTIQKKYLSADFIAEIRAVHQSVYKKYSEDTLHHMGKHCATLKFPNGECDFSGAVEQSILEAVEKDPDIQGLTSCKQLASGKDDKIYEELQKQTGIVVSVPKWLAPELDCTNTTTNPIITAKARRLRVHFMQSWFIKMENEVFHSRRLWFQFALARYHQQPPESSKADTSSSETTDESEAEKEGNMNSPSGPDCKALLLSTTKKNEAKETCEKLPGCIYEPPSGKSNIAKLPSGEPTTNKNPTDEPTTNENPTDEHKEDEEDREAPEEGKTPSAVSLITATESGELHIGKCKASSSKVASSWALSNNELTQNENILQKLHQRMDQQNDMISPTLARKTITAYEYEFANKNDNEEGGKMFVLDAFRDPDEVRRGTERSLFKAPSTIGATHFRNFLDRPQDWNIDFWRLMSPANFRRLDAQQESTQHICATLRISSADWRGPLTRINQPSEEFKKHGVAYEIESNGCSLALINTRILTTKKTFLEAQTPLAALVRKLPAPKAEDHPEDVADEQEEQVQQIERVGKAAAAAAAVGAQVGNVAVSDTAGAVAEESALAGEEGAQAEEGHGSVAQLSTFLWVLVATQFAF
eukprot:GEMP01007407.1.p1 GENE.GEMP01007407.1~~GEMP01007407.1.p1  ORF type:complete len:814 (+),score=181.26 GEMP01007407.1:353-2794(+)